MTTPALLDPRQASQAHLEIVEEVIETIQETFPAAATLDSHRQMHDILTRIKNTLDHPILFAAHIIVYLAKAVRFSRRWATLLKNIATLDTLILKRQSKAPTTHPSVLSTLSSFPSTPSVPVYVRPCLSVPSLQPSAPFRHTLETRLRIRAFAQALQHERHIAQKLPPSIPKPDLTPILPTPRHSVLTTQSSLLSLKPKAYSLQPPPPLFPSEAFWTSKVRSLQLKILGNITRVFPNVCRAYLKQYNASISSTPSTPSTPSFPHSSHPSYPSHSSPPHSSVLSSHSSALSPQHSALSSHPPSVLSTHSSVLSSHPPPQRPSQM